MPEIQRVSSPPSGRQYELNQGQQSAVVVEVGGGLRSYRVDGVEVLDGYGEDEMCTAARGQLLIPWPNRLRDGAYEFQGVKYQLAVSEPVQQNALHGLVRWSAWSPVEQGPDRVVMGFRFHPQPGYPFMLDLRAAYQLSDDGLTVTIEAENVGAQTAPFAAGQHPYVRGTAGLIDDLILNLGASTYLPVDARQIPISRAAVADTPFDFRSPRRLGQTRIDHSFTDLTRDPDGRAWITLSEPQGRQARIWLGAEFRHVMVFTGDTLGEKGRRGLGLEPMTCPPNALQTGDDLIVLEPGQRFSAAWGLQISPS